MLRTRTAAVVLPGVCHISSSLSHTAEPSVVERIRLALGLHLDPRLNREHARAQDVCDVIGGVRGVGAARLYT